MMRKYCYFTQYMECNVSDRRSVRLRNDVDAYRGSVRLLNDTDADRVSVRLWRNIL